MTLWVLLRIGAVVILVRDVIVTNHCLVLKEMIVSGWKVVCGKLGYILQIFQSVSVDGLYISTNLMVKFGRKRYNGRLWGNKLNVVFRQKDSVIRITRTCFLRKSL